MCLKQSNQKLLKFQSAGRWEQIHQNDRLMQSSAFLWAQQEAVLLPCVGIECEHVCAQQSHPYNINSIAISGCTPIGAHVVDRRGRARAHSAWLTTSLYMHTHTPCTQSWCKYNDAPLIANQFLLICARLCACLSFWIDRLSMCDRLHEGGTARGRE